MKKRVSMVLALGLAVLQIAGCAFIPEKSVKKTVSSSSGQFEIDTSAVQETSSWSEESWLDGETSSGFWDEEPLPPGAWEHKYQYSENGSMSMVFTADCTNIKDYGDKFELTLDAVLFENKTLEELFPELTGSTIQRADQADGSIVLTIPEADYFEAQEVAASRLLGGMFAIYTFVEGAPEEEDEENPTFYVSPAKFGAEQQQMINSMAIGYIQMSLIDGRPARTLKMTWTIADINDYSNVLFQKTYTVADLLSQ